MKKTIKSIIVGLALTAMANGQRGLTLEDIDNLYHGAVAKQLNGLLGSITELQANYVNALKVYRESLYDTRNPDSVDIIAALDKEINNISANEDGTLPLLVENANSKMKAMRDAYDTELIAITSKSDERFKVLRSTLSTQLIALKKRLANAGEMDKALAVHEKLIKLKGYNEAPTNQSTDESVSTDGNSVAVTKEYGGYASVKSKQKLRLVEGTEYTLTVLAQLGDKELNEHDCLPRFYRANGEKDFEGGDKNKMRRAQRASEQRMVINAGDGWSKITVKFTHSYDESVVLGVVFYDSSDDIKIALKDFTLTGPEGKNLITKDLNSSRGWEEGEFVTFNK